MKHKYLILIVGPTAVGKTDLCINLAQDYGCEIFSCDSRQFYRELTIGTAKPSKEVLAQVKHHFIDTLSIKESYSVGDYEKDCLQSLDTYFQNKDIAIMTGGSGLFAKAITHGLDMFPLVAQETRILVKKDLEIKGINSLYEELLEKDAAYAKEVDKGNPQRITRAIEVIRSSGKPYSYFRSGNSKERTFKIIKIGLNRPRPELYDRINTRVDMMIEEGLLEEVKQTLDFKNNPALQTVGYKESYEYIQGTINKEAWIELIKRNTRRYAKRQLTWFNNQDVFEWFNPENAGDIRLFLQKSINEIETKSD